MFIELDVILISYSLIDCLPTLLYPHLLYTPDSICFLKFLHYSQLANPYVISIVLSSTYQLYVSPISCSMFRFFVHVQIYHTAGDLYISVLFKCQVRAFLLVFKLFVPYFTFLYSRKTSENS